MKLPERALFLVLALVLGYLAVAFTSISGWSASPPGSAPSSQVIQLLALSAVCGVGAVALAVKAANRSAWTPLLALGLLPAGWQLALLLTA